MPGMDLDEGLPMPVPMCACFVLAHYALCHLQRHLEAL